MMQQAAFSKQQSAGEKNRECGTLLSVELLFACEFELANPYPLTE